jgi:hypothetical protein
MRQVTVPLVVAGLAFTTGCGDGGEESRGDVGRYCELVQEVEVEFSSLDIDESATPDDVARLRLDFIEAHQDEFDELREIVPDEIREEVEFLRQAERQLADGGDAPVPEAQQAEERVAEFDTENCS